MKRLAAPLLLLAGNTAPAADTLVTDSFEVSIDVRCAEGSVGCDDVRYRGVNRKTGQAISLKGRTEHTLCADRVTPCRFLGYVFRNGNVTYRVGENGTLAVTRGPTVLLQEAGAWR